jgi:hypothetical protein
MVGENMKKAVFLSITLYLMIISLSAAPYSTMGQLNAPDAYVLPHKSAEFTFTNYFRRNRSDFVGLQDYEYIPTGMIQLGLFDRLGIAVWGGDDLAFANLKLMLIEETATVPQLAIGVDNLFSPVKEDSDDLIAGDDFINNPDKALYEKNSPYICLSKASVLRNLTGLKLLETYMTAGIGMNKFKAQTPFSKRFEGLFGSITAKPHKAISLTFEFDGCDFNVGGQYAYKNFGFKIAYEGLEEQENNRIGVAISYLFDKFADSKRKQAYWLSETSYKQSELVNSQLQGKDINTNSDLLEELKKLREQREQAQKVLDDLRNQLQQMEESGNE